MDDLVERLKASVAEQLDPAQCLGFSEPLRRLARARLGDIAIERRPQMVLENRKCSYCGHTDVVKHGRDGGRQRFRCRSSFTEDDEVLGCELFDTLIHTYLPNPPHTPEML
ncbi:IS1/IS1595 family N-terminal zinc-binding domain-containing protein [Rhizobium mongolense]|uniref:Transposase-like DNA-binding protein n=2 Tax=Rhizobium mongolense TaxID=57676 RepID=A0ABR6IT87_9HYPH|nr:hypothetical protein [Rhizobium mongolense]MBB4230689.1 hypothetical protein [Rhizobium mongolense]TVZ65251.1 hypothetical protein BCL32_5540 [Rhizobium mongolense USDA 1844]